jgi:hypothetical protein
LLEGGEEVYFEDFEAGEGYWVPVDWTEQDGVFWHHVPAEGVMWCGIADHPCYGYATPPGYGNFWIQMLAKDFHLGGAPIIMDYVIQYHVEAYYDSVLVEISNDGGDTWEPIQYYTWKSGGFVTDSVDLSAYANEDVTIRFVVNSDFSFSDEDGRYDSDGACRLDRVQVTGYPSDDFDTGDDGWVASAGPGVGGGPFRLETDLAGLGDGQNHAWAAYNLEEPDAGVFPFTSEEEKDRGRWIEIGIESPVIDIPANASTYILEFDLYLDLPLENLVFFQWAISTDPNCGDSHAASDGFIRYGVSGLTTWSIDITRLVSPGETEIIVWLNAWDYWVLDQAVPFSGEHTPAPFFDNVRILAGP